MCPGGASGGMPVAVIAVGSVATLLLVGILYVANTMSQPERCGGCKEGGGGGGGGLACSNASMEVVKVRAVVSLLPVASCLLLAVLSGLALRLPEISPEGWSGMVAVTVLASLSTAASLCLFPLVFQRWVKRRFCCLCQQRVKLNQVAPIDIKVSSSFCRHCQGRPRAPEGLSYDAQDTSDLIVNVQKMISPKAGFSPGVPAAKFQVVNAALAAVTSLESVLHTATSGPLARDAKDFTDHYAQIVVTVSALMSSTTKVGKLQEDSVKFKPLSNDLDSQSLETLEKVITDLKSQEKAAVEGRQYLEAAAVEEKIKQKTEELSSYQHFKSQYLDALRGFCNEMVKEADKLGELLKQEKTIQTSIETRGQELNDVFVVVAQELAKSSSLAEKELLWLRERELSGLNSTASSASQEVTKKQQDFKSRFADLMQQVCDLLKQLEQYQQTSHTQLRAMQGLVCDTSSKPLEMQQNVCSLAPRDHAAQLQKIIDSSPKAKIIELEQMTNSFLGTLKTLVSPCVDLLKKAPVMPEGATLNESTGEIVATLAFPVSKCVFTVRALNNTGECSATVVLSAKGQIPPSDLKYPSIPAASEHANPPHSTGLVIIGGTASMMPIYLHIGSPAGTFSVRPVLPQGITLNTQTGEIHGTASRVTERQNYVLTLQNPSGKTECTLSLEVGQIAPSGLRYTTIPPSSEYADPSQSTGLLIVDDTTSMTPTCVHVGVPAGNFSVCPDLPTGLFLNAQTGEIHGTPSKPTLRKIYTVTLKNPKDKSDCTISLEVQKHTRPDPFEYDAVLRTDQKMYVIFQVGQSIVPFRPKANTQSNSLFSVSPEFPAGLSLDTRTGVIAGAPEVPLSKSLFTVTARNTRGRESTEIVLSVAGDWQICHPKEWTNEMSQLWLKNELNCNKDDRSHFLALDGRQLVQLKSKEAVASKLPSVQGILQVLIAEKVKALVDKWDQTSEQTTPLQRPFGVKAGDKVDLAYFPHELRQQYAPQQVLGVGSYGVVVMAYRIQNGHKQFKVAIKLVYAGGPHGFTDTALRRLDREASILGRIKSPHVVGLRSSDVSKGRDVFWLVMEHLEGRSLDVIIRDPDMSFTEEDIVRLALHMLSALEDLHRQNIIHRDVKPSNIVLCGGDYKLVDLGAAAVMAVLEEEVNQSLVTHGTMLNVAGTHGFMPPEAYRDRKNVGPCSDVYALSATLYLLISRQMPFQANHEFDWIIAVAGNMEEQAPRLNTVCTEHGLPGVSSGLDPRQGIAQENPRPL
jgi:hypothetical protein